MLYPYNYSEPEQQMIAAGLDSTRKIVDQLPEDFRQEHFDIFPSKCPEQQRERSQLPLMKYGGLRFDLIITVLDDALVFLEERSSRFHPVAGGIGF